MSKVTIDRDELEELVRTSLLMDELEAWGLDNWSGMEYVERPTKESIEIVIDGLTQ